MVLTFDMAKDLTYKLVNFFNTQDGKYIIEWMGSMMNLEVKPNYHIRISGISKNCSECSGCHSGNCTLGCYIEGEDRVCYWEDGLTKYIGDHLIVHEIGHVIYRQAYYSDLPMEMDFQRSETFAQLFEANFNFEY